jgi:hypothetical protein
MVPFNCVNGSTFMALCHPHLAQIETSCIAVWVALSAVHEMADW